MKKILSILAAAAMLVSCYSCNDSKKNKKDNENTEKVSEASGEQALDEPVKQEFKEYSTDYFRTVNLKLNITDEKPPLTEYSVNLSKLDFGERIPPCRDEKYIDRYAPDFSYSSDEETKRQAEEMWEKSKTEPLKGDIATFFVHKNYLYAAVNYDYCVSGGYHEVSIFRMNVDTGEKEEIYRHSDPERAISIENMYYFNDRLYMVLNLDEIFYKNEEKNRFERLKVYDSDRGVFYLDEEKQELVKIKDIAKDTTALFVPNNTGRFFVETVKTDKEIVPDDYELQPDEYLYSDDGANNYIIRGEEHTIEEYDFETKEWTALYSRHEGEYYDYDDSESVVGSAEYPAIKGKCFAWREKPEGKRKYDIVTDNYRVSTGLTSCDVEYADDSKVMVSQANINGGGGNNTRLHIFDLDKAEHYILDTSGYGSRFQVIGEGLIVSSKDNYYYLKPELGLMFKFAELEQNMSYYNPYDGKTVRNADTAAVYRLLTKNPHEVEYQGETHTEYDIETEVHWFTLEAA